MLAMSKRKILILGLAATLLALILVSAGLTQAQFSNNDGQDAAEPPYVLDHFKCYAVVSEPAVKRYVLLGDQFDFFHRPDTKFVFLKAPVRKIKQFCNPVDKKIGDESTGIQQKDDHLTFYRIKAPIEPLRQVEFNNQFGDQVVIVDKAMFLAVPSQKILGTTPEPSGLLDHFKCWRVVSSKSVEQTVFLTDQFMEDDRVRVRKPVLFCNPVTKIHPSADGYWQVTQVQHQNDHLVCYNIGPKTFVENKFGFENQFGVGTLSTVKTLRLCVPTDKTGVTNLVDVLNPAE